MPGERRLLPEDLCRELRAPPEWVEQARWDLALPCHVAIRDNSWFVLESDLHIWASAWENAIKRAAA